MNTCELLMPNSYVELDSEEMEYLDGGGVSVLAAKVTVYAVFCAVGIGSGLCALKTLKGASGKYLAKKAVPKLAQALGLTIAATVTNSIVNFIVNVADPIGWLFDRLDSADGWKDGWIGGHGWFQWKALSF